MKTSIKAGLIGALLMTLAGCGNGGSGSDPEADMEAGPAPSGVAAIFGDSRGGDPAAVANANALGAELDRIFGDANAEAFGLKAGDSIVDIFNRARNG